MTGIDARTVKKLERMFGKTITQILDVEYREERVGQFTLPIPYQRFYLKGERAPRTIRLGR